MFGNEKIIYVGCNRAAGSDPIRKVFTGSSTQCVVPLARNRVPEQLGAGAAGGAKSNGNLNMMLMCSLTCQLLGNSKSAASQRSGRQQDSQEREVKAGSAATELATRFFAVNGRRSGVQSTPGLCGDIAHDANPTKESCFSVGAV